ncbi:MAG: VanZ family protein [Bacteroidales bacterium]|nr:VanZ family protein [Bacteroidales bacterium]
MGVKNFSKFFYIYTILLILLAVLPINTNSNSINHTYVVHIRMDYLIHFAIYIPWMFLLQRMTGADFKTNVKQVMLLILAGLVFGMANEAVQYFLPYRSFNINDLLANGLGVLMGAVAFWLPSLRGTL